MQNLLKIFLNYKNFERLWIPPLAVRALAYKPMLFRGHASCCIKDTRYTLRRDDTIRAGWMAKAAEISNENK